MLVGKRWDHYETFASLTGGGGAVTQIANKINNSMYNSEPGRFPDKEHQALTYLSIMYRRDING